MLWLGEGSPLKTRKKETIFALTVEKPKYEWMKSSPQRIRYHFFRDGVMKAYVYRGKNETFARKILDHDGISKEVKAKLLRAMLR